MARFLALEWDSFEARLAVASERGGEVYIEQALSVPLGMRDGEAKSDSSPEAIGEKLRSAMSEARVRATDALVVVGRANLELKQLTLPLVPDEELPDMVRLQAMREFHSLGENWPLDYLPLQTGTQENRSVLAAAMSPELLGQFQQVCQSAGLTVARLILRPCAAASLFLRRPESMEQQVRLLVDFLNDEADLTVLVDRDAAFLRTARLPVNVLSDAESSRPLLAEIRRTIAAAQNQLGGRKVEAIYVCGTQAEHAAVVSRLEQELGLPARLFDPLSGLKVDPALKRSQPGNIGRFAPLLGMLADEIEEVRHGMDFLNPRKRPVPPSKRNRYAAYGAVAAAMLLLAMLFMWQRLASLDAEIASLNEQLKLLEPVVKSSLEVEQAVTELKNWSKGDIVWLDELRELSEEFPPAQEAMITQLRFSPHNEGGIMIIEGLVKEGATADLLQSQLRDERHIVSDRQWNQDTDVKPYGLKFKSEIVVKNEMPPTSPASVKQAGQRPTAAIKLAEKPADKKGQ